jgi:hypothetical protein
MLSPFARYIEANKQRSKTTKTKFKIHTHTHTLNRVIGNLGEKIPVAGSGKRQGKGKLCQPSVDLFGKRAESAVAHNAYVCV